MSKNQPPTNKKELTQYLQDSTSTVLWVPRKLLIKALGADKASKHLPELPDMIAVNRANVLADLEDD